MGSRLMRRGCSGRGCLFWQQGAEGGAQEAKMMRTLEAFIAKLGGSALAPGWRCVVKVRSPSYRRPAQAALNYCCVQGPIRSCAVA